MFKIEEASLSSSPGKTLKMHQAPIWTGADNQEGFLEEGPLS